jgi:hypothetical protein
LIEGEKAFGVTIGVILSDFPLHQSFKFSFAYLVIAFENLHGFMTARRHYTKVVMPLQPAVIDVVKTAHKMSA